MAVKAQAQGEDGDEDASGVPERSPAERRAARLYEVDRQFRDAKPLDEVTDAIREPGIGLPRIMATVMAGYADRPAFAERVQKLVTDPDTGRTALELLPEFHAVTYREVRSRIQALASELASDPKCPAGAGDFVCTLGFTSGDYATVDLACVHLGLVSVPLHAGAGVGVLGPIVAETAPRILATSLELLDTAVELALGVEGEAAASLRRLIVFDCELAADEHRERYEAAARRLAAAGSPVAMDVLNSMLERGSSLPDAPLCTSVGEDSLTSLLYTSGSTGAPKGAMYTQRLATYLWGASWRKTDTPVITLNYLPMSHLAGRYMLFSTLSAGGTVHFTARSDLSLLFEDMSLVRPTDLMLVPRISEMVFQQYQSEVDRRVSGGSGGSGGGSRAAVEAEVRTQWREQVLGGRIVRVMCGSAPLDAETAAFLEACLELKPLDGYGATEAGMITTGHRLAPPVIDYKLADVPELGYFGTDSPYPRGELRVKTEMIMAGYYKRPDATAAAFDEDGYYRTGDIMALTGPGELVYVDRTKNVLKLSQGELVAVSRLETVFAESPLIRQVFVYGSSERSYLLAVVVPTPDAVERAESDGRTGALKSALSGELQRTAKEAGLNSYEIPRDFIVETEPFSIANGLLTDAGKLARPMAKARYARRLEQLYTDIAAEQSSELRALRREGRGRPVQETVGRAVRSLLGCSSTDLDPGVHFTDLGGDSLSALSFSRLLYDIYGVEVPVGFVTGPTTDLRRLAGYVESRLGSSCPARPTYATVHGAGAGAADGTAQADGTGAREAGRAPEVRAEDLTLEKFIDAAVLDEAKALPRSRQGNPVRTVLLTGANGYLGRFLCLEWLQRLAERGGTLVCVVRGADDEEAHRRLDAAFDTGDPELLARYRQSTAAGRLEVLAGDLDEPNLGLDGATWDRLAADVDLIAHPAALVNHVLPYDQLFGPNVAGTAELIRLAVTTQIKPFVFVSSMAAGTQLPGPLTEDGDIRAAVPVRRIDSSYAGGYGTSKWAGEVLLREAHDLCGLPCAVFRSDMILAHSRYRGQLNVPDLFTRLMLSLVATGIAPSSFYKTGVDGGDGGDGGSAGEGERGGGRGGRSPRPHFDGLPADFTAEAVAAIAERFTHGGFDTYNVVNPHDDGVSLDVLVDWLADSARPIQHIDDYGEWLARFETALRGLPEEQRQHSLLPLLDAFREPMRATAGAGVPVERFSDAVREAGVGDDGSIPRLGPSLIAKYTADLRHLGLL
ncbi:carboxylic acid reductase [Streptomyces marispadix]|uniref:Carboxylic acid reductase n=1 Tax=Streptomyces marispadix TaxID=2922868 RepID=A0ABS9SX74_9ACTN|nr:carboxylic acid reductase [Streptomyces marispadix]MCH6160855.1 thioester reductase domain-containing protein [Streptomyces marispadix]